LHTCITNPSAHSTTGAIGYVGGTALCTFIPSPIISKLRISALIRNAAQAHPSIRVITGDLGDASLIEQEARNSDIIVNLVSTSHLGSAKAITRGLSNSKRDAQKYWIQIGGATPLEGKEITEGRFGFESHESYDDIEDNSSNLSLIKNSSK